jgi:HEXXH motif-containing protein
MAEINETIVKILPFDVSYQVHNSGSFSDAIGHLLMSYPTGIDYPEIALLEAILHEYNHNKLNLILQTEDLVLNDRKELYYSPYRPDARHIHGIYL